MVPVSVIYYISFVCIPPLGSNIPTRPSYRPPPATEPTDGTSTLLLEEGQLSVPNIIHICKIDEQTNIYINS